MKKVMLALVVLVSSNLISAQDKKGTGDGQTVKDKWLIEANTGFGSGVGTTSFGLVSEDGTTSWNVGAEAGYFVIDDLALKVGLGYGDDGSDLEGSSAFAYKIGAKYYIVSQFPVELSYNGVSIKDYDENPSDVGFQAGYAWFLSSTVSLEPGIRYNLSLNNDFYDDALQFNIGFALHF
jgi:hypothetical protein